MSVKLVDFWLIFLHDFTLFVIDIQYTSDYAHFTFLTSFDHFHFHPIPGYTEKLSYFRPEVQSMK